MKKISILSNAVLSSMLFWGVPTVEADELIVKEAASSGSYCHMQFPAIRGDTLSWDRPALEEGTGNVVDFYGSCDHDPTGSDEIKAQDRVSSRGFYGDGE